MFLIKWSSIIITIIIVIIIIIIIIILLLLLLLPKGYFDNGGVSSSKLYVRPELSICTRDDEHSRPFHIGIPTGYRTSPLPLYSRLHRVKLVILWISDASTQYITAEMIYIK